MVCLGPRDPVDIAGPRALSAVVVRPLNFTVRRHHAHNPLSHRWVPALGRLLSVGAAILGPLTKLHVRHDGGVHMSVAGDLRVQFMGRSFKGRLQPVRGAAHLLPGLCRAGCGSDLCEMAVLLTSGSLRVPSNNRWRAVVRDLLGAAGHSEIAGPPRLSGARARLLNFTVRSR